jgi:hypothetical protein
MMLAEVAEQRAHAVPSAPLTEFELLRRSLVSCRVSDKQVPNPEP